MRIHTSMHTYTKYIHATVAAASALLPGWSMQGRMALGALIAAFGAFFAVGCKGFCKCVFVWFDYPQRTLEIEIGEYN